MLLAIILIVILGETLAVVRVKSGAGNTPSEMMSATHSAVCVEHLVLNWVCIV